MAHKIRRWYSILNKILAILSVVLSLAVLASTVYTLTKVNRKHHDETPNEFNSSSSEMTLAKTPRKFRSVVNICSAISLGCAFIQCIVSFRTLISCSDKFGVGLKTYLFVHFAAFLLYLTAIIVPLVYYDGKISSILNPKHFKLTFSEEDMTHFLNAYFATIIANDAFLLIFLLFNCICLKRVKVDTDEPDDQKQKLLSAESNELYKY